MKPDDPQPVQPADGPLPAEKGQRSGEGAATALQALIRNRKQVEGHEDPGAPPPKAPQP